MSTNGVTRGVRAHRRGVWGLCAAAGAAALMVLGTALPASASSHPAWSPGSVISDAVPVARDHPAPPAGVRSSGATDCSSLTSIGSCVLGLLAPGGGTQGIYLKQVGGAVLAQSNATFAYEPASSIKPVIALYAIRQVEERHISLSTQIPMISGAGGTEDCPPSTLSGTEPLGNALARMLQVSDNNRTRELMQYFGVANLNAFAASLGLSDTMFQTSTSAPGFNVIGCLSYGFSPLPATVDGNTMSLADAATLWSDIATLPSPYAEEFSQLAAGRDMYNNAGYDFTGLWPTMKTIASDETPAGMTTNQLNSYIDHMSVSVKGGSYEVADCTGAACQADWWVFAGVADIPSCSGTSVKHTNYAWGYFIDDAIDTYNSNPDLTASGTAFFAASGQLLAAPIAQGLAGWKKCAPLAKVVLHAKGVNATLTTHTVGLTTTLATLSDSDRYDIAPDLVGTVSWGDHTESTATITAAASGFTIRGWHAYAKSGKYPVSIKVTDRQGLASAATTLTLSVS